MFVTGGLVATLPAAAGLARAKALMMLGEAFTAAQAREWGLVWAVAPDADLEAVSARLAAQLAALAPAVVRRYKQVLNRVGLAGFDAAIDAENAAQRALQRG